MKIRAIMIDDDYEEIERLAQMSQRFSELGWELDIHPPFPRVVDALAYLKPNQPLVDVVFVDLIGPVLSDAENPDDDAPLLAEAIEEIRSAHPFVPIIVLSKIIVLEFVLAAWERGAGFFLQKVDPPPSVWQGLEDWKIKVEEAVTHIIRVVQPYIQLKPVLFDSPQIGMVRKSGTVVGSAGERTSIIRDQYNFLLAMQSRSDEVRAHFPEVTPPGGAADGTTFTYRLPFYRYRSLRHLILNGDHQERTFEWASQILTEVLRFMERHLYESVQDHFPPHGYLESQCFGKFAARLNETRELVLTGTFSIAGAANDYDLLLFQRILNADTLNFRGRIHRSPDQILSELHESTDFLSRATPPYLCLTHGDLHFDNILVEDRLMLPKRFILIDPRGAQDGRGLLDRAYDYGKLLHSTHGLYDFIHEGYLRYDGVQVTNGCVEVGALEFKDWILRTRTGGGSGDEVVMFEIGERQSRAREVFRRLDAFIINELDRCQERDPSIKLRSYLHEALHFCTMAPFHIGEDPQRALHIYLRGVELMNEFYWRYKAGEFEGVTQTSPEGLG